MMKISGTKFSRTWERKGLRCTLRVNWLERHSRVQQRHFSGTLTNLFIKFDFFVVFHLHLRNALLNTSCVLLWKLRNLQVKPYLDVYCVNILKVSSSNILYCINLSRYILILSREAWKSDKLSFKCIQLLSNSVTENQVNVIPVLNNRTHNEDTVRELEGDDVPRLVRWVTLLTTRDLNYCEQLFNTVSGIMFCIIIICAHL